jgi:hypothetical protein
VALVLAARPPPQKNPLTFQYHHCYSNSGITVKDKTAPLAGQPLLFALTTELKAVTAFGAELVSEH